MTDFVRSCKVFSQLEFFAKRESSSLVSINVLVSSSLVNKIKKYTFDIYKNKIKTKGFHDGSIPEKYVENHCSVGILDSCSSFILKFFVLDFLDENAKSQKMVCLAPPKLIEIKVLENGAIEYMFKASIVSSISPDSWEKIHFLAPKRKLYKDLDRQAMLFIKAAEEELSLKSRILESSSIIEKKVEDSDWVEFSAVLLNSNNQPAIREYGNKFWLKIDTKYVVTPMHKSFLGRQEGDFFVVESLPIFGAPTDLLSIKGKFRITINCIVKSSAFSLDSFKNIFDLQAPRDVHEKLIEIFSFRNDISQRRLIIDEAFRVLFGKIRFEIPRYLVLRRQERLLDSVKKLPDYNVYKMSENFDKQLGMLAEKQIKEEALVRQIGFNENIEVSHKDVLEYLNLFNHPRLTEFLYFLPTIEYVQGVCLPIKESYLLLSVLKEKVLNHIIARLSSQ